MKIGGRLNLLIGVPLLALAVAVGVGSLAVRRASVSGADYRATKQAQELRVVTARPDASLLAAWADANALAVDAGSASTLDRRLTQIDTDRKTLDAALVALTGQATSSPVVRDFVAQTRAAERTFFDIVDNDLRPAVDAGNATAIRAAVQRLETPATAQRIAADRIAAWAKVQVLTHERNTDATVRSVMIFGGGAVVLVLLLTLLLSVRVRRSIVRPIREMASRSRDIATVELPAAVDSIRRGAAAPAIEVAVSGGSPEIVDLGESVASLATSSVDLAVGQVAARQAVSDSMVNIARRSQTLLGRTLGLIASLERDERDSDSLDQLFRLDHLATRMRRNAQSLLVLAGAEPTAQRSAAVPLGDVVRAALSEIENYAQVEVGELGMVHITGTVAADLAHLLAELLENATTFAPPTSPVTVIGRSAGDGHQLAVYDFGIGMTADELADANRRLALGAAPAEQAGRQLGFQVVARLAARHGIHVSLAATPGGSGVTAVVRLPGSVVDCSTAVSDLPPPPQPVLVVAEPAVPLTTALPKRVRGATAVLDEQPTLPRLPERPTPEQVRSNLAGLQRGLETGRRTVEGDPS